MTIKFIYDKKKGVVAIKISEKQYRKYKTLFSSDEKCWDIVSENILDSHPDYDVLAPRLLEMKLKARKIIASGISDPVQAMKMIFDEDNEFVKFSDFARNYAKELRQQAAANEKKGNIKNRNNLIGTAKVVENTINQFDKILPDIAVNSLSHSDLLSFRKFKESEGNSKSTIHLYLRTLRSLYNKAIKIYNIQDRRPFDGIFSGLKIKSYESKKKYITKESIEKLENTMHYAESASKYVDLWLLQFYFAGADLIDIYFLKKNQLQNGRLIFQRGKTDVFVNLIISKKAQKIIDKWKTDDSSEWLFPWRKDNDGYKTFASRMYKYLIKTQQRENIEVLPSGGNLAVKVARHTFATIAKQNDIDGDLLRELMGHERDDVDNYYKDKFSTEIRDNALLKIIE